MEKHTTQLLIPVLLTAPLVPVIIIAPVLIHELGHLVVALLLGVNLTWVGWSHATLWEYPTAEGMMNVQAVMAAGNIMSLLVGVVLLILAYTLNRRRICEPYAFTWALCLGLMTLLYGVGQISVGYWM